MFSTIQNTYASGELSPSLYGRTDLNKWHGGASTMRNFFVNYRGGASSRAGLAYVGMCKQGAPNAGGTATDNPPRDINFQFSINQGYALEFGDNYMRIKSRGAYVIEAAKNITGITNADPAVFTVSSHGYSNGDWIFITGVAGMTNFNGLTWIVQNVTTNTFTVTDLFGNAINSTLFPVYISGGTTARIYTIATPYAAADLPFLKYTQSADTMTLTCVNQLTLTEYPSYELVRNGATNWSLTPDDFAAVISPPNSVNSTILMATTVTAGYAIYGFVVTSVDDNGNESVASPIGLSPNNTNYLAINSGQLLVTWAAAPNAVSYNIYSCEPSIASTPGAQQPIPAGTPFGLLSEGVQGLQLLVTNPSPDYTRQPPTHNDPFAESAVLSVETISPGSSYASGTTATLTDASGSGAIILPVVVSGEINSFILLAGGKGYTNPTIVLANAGGGSGFTGTVNLGPATGTYPGVCGYYQQRRAYAFTLNDPNTYFMSQPGLYNNMDVSSPVIDSDAITGSPWAQQLNGIQFMVTMPGGLVILSGNGAWQVNGGANAALTPADQTAAPQAYNGCHFYIPPITVNYDILYVQSKGSIVRDLSYNFFVNIYTGTDMTVLSNHLFNYHQLQQWAYAEEPYKIIWAVRDDGILLSLTYLKEQEVYGWARHDTNGQFVGVCSVTEPPVDAVYVIVKRYIQGEGVWAYYSERMDNRNWPGVEDCFCVDAGLSLPMSFPNATLMPEAANGTANISFVNLISGGAGYTAPSVRAVDATGIGTGATFQAFVVGGVITSITPLTQGALYQPGTTLVITDTTGAGALAQPVVTNNIGFTASGSVFTPAMVGDVIRIGNNNAAPASSFTVTPNGGGKAVITSYVSATEVIANIIEPITNVIPNDPFNMPAPVSPNNWSLATPVTAITGLNHLEGMEVAILADGSVVPNQTVSNGSITLPAPYSAITIGLPYLCQLQNMYLDPPGQPVTVQGKRKTIYSATIRVESSRGLQVGANQPDASTQPFEATVPWTDMKEIKERNSQINAGTAIPLFTGDIYKNIPSDWSTKGQLAIQQPYPLPANILATILNYQIGDTAG